MKRRQDSFWHTVGRTIGELTLSLDSGSGSVATKGRSAAPGKRKKDSATTPDPLVGILAGAIATWGTALMSRGLRRRAPIGILARGAAAGAGAAGVLVAFRIIRDRDIPRSDEVAAELLDELLAGAGRGVIYAALLDPWLPGPPVARGALAGTADYLATPLGGLFSGLQRFSPVRRIPLISILLETGDSEDESYPTHLLHGAILGLLYGDRSSS